MNRSQLAPVSLGLLFSGLSLFQTPSAKDSTRIPTLPPEQREILSHLSIVYRDDGVGGDYSSISGGRTNAATTAYSWIGGGSLNSVIGANYGVTSGGLQNSVSGTYGAVSGGWQRSVGGNYDCRGGGLFENQ